VAKLELEVARRSLDAVLARYEDGRVNRLAVEQARVEEDESWVNFFQAGYQAEKARLELLRLSGEIRNVFN
jgi:outer membrane protein TolC